MGNVIFGVPEDLTLDLAKSINARIFVETGTYKGNTAIWAGKNFHKVVTIEFDKGRYKNTFIRISNMIDTSNIKMLQGNSKDVLKSVLDKTNEPVIFWLDAHGLGKREEKTTQEDEIPLMQELAIIFDWQQRTEKECCILIDDARLFLEPPPKPYHPEYWPNVDNIADAMPFHEMTIAKDVIVLHKKKQRDIVLKWSELE